MLAARQRLLAYFLGVLGVLRAVVTPPLAEAQVLRENLWVTNGRVDAIAVAGGIVYLGGRFTQVGPATGSWVAIDAATGAALQPYPTVMGTVSAAAPDGTGGWYIGGSFTAVRGQPRNNLARLDATGNLTAWDPNANDAVRALAVSGGTVYAGGEFIGVLRLPHSRIVGLSEAVVGVEEPVAGLLPGRLSASPNPSHTTVTLRFALPQSEDAEVGVYDLAGRLVRRLARGALLGGEQRMTWDGRDDAGRAVGAGLYLVRVRAGTLRLRAKLVRMK